MIYVPAQHIEPGEALGDIQRDLLRAYLAGRIAY